ncbi:MAG: dTDP-4-dehydrorhamnose reductase [Saprospiraceae bacterium]
MKENKKILVTGASGQLGRSFQSLTEVFDNLEFVFTDVEFLDITNIQSVNEVFSTEKPNYCINCAAYTLVDKAEENVELNNRINIDGPKNLAHACKDFNAKLIHISSDYVYNGFDQNVVFAEDDYLNPLSVYAKSKLEGELQIKKYLSDYMIFRTSWLYSEYGNNFVKTILKYSKERDELKVVNDQEGSPTYAIDLAHDILKILARDDFQNGIYNYSNEGFVSWFEFAKEIVDYSNINCKILPIATKDYPTAAKRPLNSKMSKQKFITSFNIPMKKWQESLHICINNLKKS